MDILTSLPDDSEPRLLILGTFDGLHRGHQKVISQGLKRAEEEGLPSTVVTFDPEPEAYFEDIPPGQRRLLTREDKLNIINDLGIDSCVELEFSAEFAELEPAEFVKSILIEKLNAAVICAGFNYNFGARGQGTTSQLRDLASTEGFELELCPPVEFAGRPVSSSRIRNLIKRGKMQPARDLLTRPYTVYETAQAGRARGRELGFPTLNFTLTGTIRPCPGVYLTWLGTKKRRPAVANYGSTPTFEGRSEPLLEVHVIDREPELGVGDRTHVYFEKFQRQEMEFDSATKLVEQIEEDVELARSYFAEHSSPEIISGQGCPR